MLCLLVDLGCGRWVTWRGRCRWCGGRGSKKAQTSHLVTFTFNIRSHADVNFEVYLECYTTNVCCIRFFP